MVQIVGKYEHVSSDGLEHYLTTAGGAENAEVAKVFSRGKPVLEVSQVGDQWTITVTNEGKSSITKFQLGAQYEEQMPHGAVFKSVTTRDGDTFTTVSVLPNGNQSVRVYEFTEDGIVVHLSEKMHGATALRYYKRV